MQVSCFSHIAQLLIETRTNPSKESGAYMSAKWNRLEELLLKFCAGSIDRLWLFQSGERWYWEWTLFCLNLLDIIYRQCSVPSRSVMQIVSILSLWQKL